MKVWLFVLLFINATNSLAADDTSAIAVRETTQYSADIELVDKQHHRSIYYAKCNCTQTYTNEYRDVISEESQVKEHFPDRNSRVWISNLIPNCNYICIVAQRNSEDYRTLSLVTFSTKYAAPSPPPTPEVTTEITNRQLVVTILLLPSSTKLTPISGYKLQFYVVVTDADGKPVLTQSKPSELIPSLEEARNSDTPTDFLYQTYDAASMPDTVIVQPVVLLGAFKHNFTYSAVLAAYRNESEGHEYEETTSEPSAAFKILYSAESDRYNFRARYARNVIGIVLGGVVPVLLCISGIILLSMWCKYRKKKATNARFQRQKQEKFKYPTFDATKKSLFTIKSPSPQYQPKKNLNYDHDQMFELPTNRRASDGLMDKGIDAFRRTSITLVNAFTNFTHSLKRYSWISDVDELIEEEKEGFTESDEFVDSKAVADDGSKANYFEDPMEDIDIEIAGSSNVKNTGNNQSAEDPERVMGNVITLCSTPNDETTCRSVSDNQLQMVDITPEKPQQESLQ